MARVLALPVALFVSLLVTSCAQNCSQEWTPPKDLPPFPKNSFGEPASDPSKNAQILYDEVSGQTSIAWEIEDLKRIEGARPRSSHIFGVDKKPDVVSVGVFYTANDWAFYNQAYAGGKEHDLVVLERKVISRRGGVQESLSIVVKKEDFESVKTNGFEACIAGRHETSAFFIPAHNFASFFETYDEVGASSLGDR